MDSININLNSHIKNININNSNKNSINRINVIGLVAGMDAITRGLQKITGPRSDLRNTNTKCFVRFSYIAKDVSLGIKEQRNQEKLLIISLKSTLGNPSKN